MTAKITDRAATIRDLARQRGRRLQPVHIVLDDEIRDQLAKVQQAVEELEAAKAVEGELDKSTEAQPDGFLGEAPKDYDQLIVEAKAARDELEDEAASKDAVIAVNFRRLNPDDYQRVVDEAEQHISSTAGEQPTTPMLARLTDEISKRLVPLCYVSTTALDGEDLGMTLDELRADVLNHADMDVIEAHCITINRTGQAVDFHRPSSGMPATS